jgi:hypothetical protein
MYEIGCGSQLWRLATGAMSRSGARERGVCVLLCERDAGRLVGGDGAVHERPERGGGGCLCVLCARENRGGRGLSVCCEFWKMVYEKKFRKPFFDFLDMIF